MGTNGKGNGLLEIHHELVGLVHLEYDLRTQLHQVVEKRGALEQTLKSWPASAKAKAKPIQARPRGKVAKAFARAERKAATRAKRAKGKGGGAPAAVLSLLQAHRGQMVAIKAIKEQLSDLPPASVHQALTVLKKRGQAKSGGAGKWAWTG